MKKIVLLLFIAMFLHSGIWAQTKFGVQVGLNISNLHSSYNDEKAIPGFNTGLFITHQLAKRFYLNTSLLYSSKGYSNLYIPSGTTYNRLYYVSLPVLLDYAVSKKFFISIGPEFDLLTKATTKNSDIDRNTTDSYRQFDWGIDAGASYHINKKIIIGLRYNYGLSKVGIAHGIDINGGPGFTTYYGNNRVLQVNVGYVF